MGEPHLVRMVKREAKRRFGRTFPGWIGPGRYQRLRSGYQVADQLSKDGKVPMRWWPVAPNFGDAMSPWLVEKMTGTEPTFVEKEEPGYVAIGSVLKRVGPRSIVWGTGSFGDERNGQINTEADYRAVRGPLTRAKIVGAGGSCPRVYGDPALLAPLYFFPRVERTHDIGLVLRWSERSWHKVSVGDGIKLINLNTEDVEAVLLEMLGCRRIVTSSLHGLIVSDAYGISNAWLASESPRGGEFKFYDYFASVNKLRHAHVFEPTKGRITVERLMRRFDFDDRPIDFNYRALLDACPFLSRT